MKSITPNKINKTTDLSKQPKPSDKNQDKPSTEESPKVKVDTSISKKTVITKKKKDEAIFVPLPPTVVNNSFLTSYATATGVIWSKEIPDPKVADKTLRDYKVCFIFLDMNNSAIYAKNGDLIELRMQILPVQLPSNVYEAIKLKYPDVVIITAYTLKNTKLRGAYVANLQSANTMETKEVILTDKGSFVE